MFKRKKMSDTDHLIEEHPEGEDLKIPVNDKRRFNEQGERVAPDAEAPVSQEKKDPVPSAKEIELENQLKAEIERREAAEAKLVGVQAKFDEAKANLEKETAEMRTRMMKTLEDRSKQGQFSFLTTLLPVLDNLHLAVSASETDSSIENFRQGVIGTARSFEQALASVGVEVVPGVGSTFDPEVHEAIDMVEVDPEMDGKIVSEYQRGYKF